MHVQQVYGNLTLKNTKNIPLFITPPLDFWTYQDPYDALHAFFLDKKLQEQAENESLFIDIF